jgi:hypothetical protein
MILDDGASHLGETPRKAAGLLVPPFGRERGVAADVGDQERVYICVPA